MDNCNAYQLQNITICFQDSISIQNKAELCIAGLLLVTEVLLKLSHTPFVHCSSISFHIITDTHMAHGAIVK